MSALSIEDCFYPSDFYRAMESQREKLPGMSRQKYAPIFIINTLRDKLESMETKRSSLDSPHPRHPKEPSEKWTDDTLLEENADFEGTYLIHDKEGKRYIKRLLTFAILAKETEGIGLDPFEFSRLFCREVEFPPLELVWMFSNKFNLLGINAYFMKLKSQNQIDYLVKQFLSFCFSPCLFEHNTKSKGTRMLQDLLHEIIIAAHCNPQDNTPLKKVWVIANDILIKITNKLISSDVLSCSYMNRQFMIAILQGVPIADVVKKRYFAHHLNYILTNEKCQMSLQEILQYQERFAKPIDATEEGKADAITLFLGPPQSRTEVIESLNKNLKHLDILNMEAFLLTITVWERSESVHSSQMMFSLLKQVIRELVVTGLDEEHVDMIMVAFILARHCCLISPHNFARYEKWYAGMFEKDTSPADTVTTFEFLAKVLTDWVPFEPPMFLQVHATYWPHTPPGMRTCWNDYVTLSKTRIAEYTEVEQAMEYEPNPNNPVQHDVEMAIKSYETTSKIPNTILEMMMFRKQYYLEQFLPTLLRKPLGVVLSDARLRLIEVLNAADKIPAELYTAYKAGDK